MHIFAPLNRSLLTLTMVLVQILFCIGQAQAQVQYPTDVRESAEYIARSGVRTAYDNMTHEGISWSVIRDRELPALLDRVINSLKNRYSNRVLKQVYIPAFTRAFYNEVDKINRENRYTCVPRDTLDLYYTTIVTSCRKHLNIDVSQGVEPILKAKDASCT